MIIKSTYPARLGVAGGPKAKVAILTFNRTEMNAVVRRFGMRSPRGARYYVSQQNREIVCYMGSQSFDGGLRLAGDVMEQSSPKYLIICGTGAGRYYRGSPKRNVLPFVACSQFVNPHLTDKYGKLLHTPIIPPSRDLTDFAGKVALADKWKSNFRLGGLVSGSKYFYKDLPKFHEFLRSNPEIVSGDMEAAGIGSYLYSYQFSQGKVVHYIAIKGATDFFNHGTADDNQELRNRNRGPASELAAEFAWELVEEITAFEHAASPPTEAAQGGGRKQKSSTRHLEFPTDDPLDTLSWNKFPKDDPLQQSRPLVVRTQDFATADLLKWRMGWPVRDFFISLVDEFGFFREKGSPVLRVRVGDNPLAIYNVAGRDFLRDRYLSGPYNKRKAYDVIQRKFDRFVQGGRSFEVTGHGDPPELPFRWASGGGLAIVKYKRRWWAGFSFRNVDPVAWNMANGGSETRKGYRSERQEWIDIESLAEREFLEELMLIKDVLLPESRRARQIHLSLRGPPRAAASAEEFTEEAHDLRRSEHPSLDLDWAPYEESGRVEMVASPDCFRVDVLDSNAHFTRDPHKPQGNFIVSVNCMDTLGIETIRLFSVDMDECGANYILDGEIAPDNKTLLRRPVILISLGYLYKTWERGGVKTRKSLVESQLEKKQDCVVLPSPLKGTVAGRANMKNTSTCDFVLFDYDIRTGKNPSLLNEFGYLEGQSTFEIKNPIYRAITRSVWRTLDYAFKKELLKVDRPASTQRRYADCSGNTS